MTGSPPRGSRRPYAMPFSHRPRPNRRAVASTSSFPGQDELGAHLDDAAVRQLARPHTAADPVARLEHDHVAARLEQGIGGRETGEPGSDHGDVDQGCDRSPNRRSRSALATTDTLDSAIASPAITGLRNPAAASGSAATL